MNDEIGRADATAQLHHLADVIAQLYAHDPVLTPYVARLRAAARHLEEPAAPATEALPPDDPTYPLVLRTLLLLADRDVDEATIRGWTIAQREAVEEWAVAIHLAAGDHAVALPRPPACLREASRGTR